MKEIREHCVTDDAKQQYDNMISACPWAEAESAFVVVIEDDSSNFYEVVGCGTTRTNVKPALRAALKRLKNYGTWAQVGLLHGGRTVSWVL